MEEWRVRVDEDLVCVFAYRKRVFVYRKRRHRGAFPRAHSCPARRRMLARQWASPFFGDLTFDELVGEVYEC